MGQWSFAYTDGKGLRLAADARTRSKKRPTAGIFVYEQEVQTVPWGQGSSVV